MRKYHEIKKSDPNSKEADIAVQLKIPSRTLSTWKKELGLVRKNSYSNKEKMELIQKFEEMKGKQSQSSSKLSEQIAKDLGVSYFTICHWKRQLGLQRRLTYTKSDKIKLMEKYFKIKRRHPELSDVKISKRLNIRNSNMWKWRQQFINKNANAESSANDELPKEKQLERKSYSENEKMELMHFLDESVGIIMDSSPCQTMPTGIAWEWNRCTKGRKQRKCRRSVLN
uniref:Transposase n=1 Tax=Globodera pallida TaxID=36090 RepID=A0A183CA83_GLOPA